MVFENVVRVYGEMEDECFRVEYFNFFYKSIKSIKGICFFKIEDGFIYKCVWLKVFILYLYIVLNFIEI